MGCNDTGMILKLVTFCCSHCRKVNTHNSDKFADILNGNKQAEERADYRWRHY